MNEPSGQITRRVACLYRVSTKRQAEDNDIPMQKNACRAFIARNDGWALVCEYTEAGVSGYHKSAGQRDVLQKARQDAERGLFDVLLVFMFDRLGRREDETPFVVEWFAAQGVDVWSVKEGPQRFDNRVDKLLNYIRYWQSGGESEKTSIRVKEKHRQMVEDGQFRGGNAPYGYYLADAGRANGRGYPLKKLVIDENECSVVRTVFRLAAERGYGGRRIAQYLNSRSIPTKNGNRWTAVSVLDLLKNPIYMGRFISGRRQSERGRSKRVPPSAWVYAREIDPTLVMVEETLWRKAETLRLSRTQRNNTSGTLPQQTSGRLLLTGLARCGICGKAMTSRFASRVRKRNGACELYKQEAYRCLDRGSTLCVDHRRTFDRKPIDAAVLAAVRPFFACLPKWDVYGKVRHLQEESTVAHTLAITRTETRLTDVERDLRLLYGATADALRGEGAFTAEQLSSATTEREAERKRLQEQLLDMRIEAAQRVTEGYGVDNNSNIYVITDWYALFDAADISAQKMILSRLLRAVHIYDGKVVIYTRVNWFT